MSLFITFEGIEGCGKSTQSKILKKRLDKMAIPALLTHEPGVTALGKRINHLLKWTEKVSISPVAELLLFNVSRAQLVSEVIRPAISRGTIIICDRYADSTVAYQGYGRELDLGIVNKANETGTQGIVPDMTILLDMPVETGMQRKEGEKPDRFESESLEFHQKVRQGYLKLAAEQPQRWVVIEADQDKRTIGNLVWQAVASLMKVNGRIP
jgi:dTMP kinase